MNRKQLTLTIIFVFFFELQLCAQPGSFLINRGEVSVLGRRMSYLHAEQNRKSDTVFVFVHGNPTQAYLWRNIIPDINGRGRALAPDLIGMGQSEKLPASIQDRYTYACHEKFLDKFLEQTIQPDEKVVLVGHDWGGVLSNSWARRNAERVVGIIFMETFLEPHYTGKTPKQVIDWFAAFRTEERSRDVLEDNYFVENIFLRSLPALAENDRDVYRRPFLNPDDDRLPTLVWPQQVPIDGNPEYTDSVFKANMEFLTTSSIPKLFINATPGALLGNLPRQMVIRQWNNLTECKVDGNHFIQEQSPKQIGDCIQKWLNK